MGADPNETIMDCVVYIIQKMQQLVMVLNWSSACFVTEDGMNSVQTLRFSTVIVSGELMSDDNYD